MVLLRQPQPEPREAPPSLGDQAYRRLLAALFDGRLKPGATVSQRELVTLIGIPLQPLRDALTVLEAEGVVTILPRSGIRFLKPDHALIHGTYQFRAIIERAAARQFAMAADDHVLEALADAHRDVLADLDGGAFDERMLNRIVDLERRLHDGMTAALGNRLILAEARRLKNYLILIRLDVVMTRFFAVRAMREHLAIIDACLARDAAAAEEALAEHFRQSLARMTGNL